MKEKLARLEELTVREAWESEAFDFTPWLAGNLEFLGEVIGLPLEAEGSEVAVESFSADILARSKYDDTRVLIENQLETSDHTHLGQILTYLAGLEAKVVVWVAPSFRDAHLSAVNWLNENTDESVSFFAVKVKVVRIGDSPLAPVFEVTARPNEWERRMHAAKASSGTRSQLSQQRYEFWEAYVNGVAGEEKRGGPPSYASNRWHPVEGLELLISIYTSTNGVGLFIRAPYSGDHDATRLMLASRESALSERLGIPMGNSEEYHFTDSHKGDYTDPDQWPELIKFLGEKADLYEKSLKEVFDSDDE